MGNLAFFCCDHLDSPGRAEPLFVECLDRANRTLGHEHPFTLLCTSNFGACLRELGRLAEARATLEACVDAAGRVLGPEHRYAVLATDNLGLCLLRQGEAGEAARVLAGIEDAMARATGPQSFYTERLRRRLAEARSAIASTSAGSAAVQAVNRDVERRRELWRLE